MSSCALPLCKNSQRKGNKLFIVPTNQEIAKKWIEFMRENEVKNINKNSRLCEDHFTYKNGNKSLIPTIGLIKMGSDVVTEKENIFENNGSTNKYSMLLTRISDLEMQNGNLRKENSEVLQRFNALKDDFTNMKNNLKNFFNDDQIRALTRKNMKFSFWSDETCERSIALRYKIGSSAYETVRSFLPLPTDRTLSKRLENFHLVPGVNVVPIKFLDQCFAGYPHHKRRGVLVYDQMSVIEGIEADHMGNSIGYETLNPEIRRNATNGLVALFAGTVIRFKQIIGYHLTGKSVDGEKYKEFVMNCLNELWNYKIWIDALVFDMGFENIGLMKALGFSVTAQNRECSIPHPLDPHQKLWICFDSVHEFKNIGSNFRTKDALIPQSFVDKYNLDSPKAKSSDVKRIFNLQKKMIFKPARKLTDTILQPDHFSKMRVNTHTRYFSSDVSTTMSFLFEDDEDDIEKFLSHSLDEYQRLDTKKHSTTWMFNLINRWIKAMKNKSQVNFANKGSTDDTKKFLKECVLFFEELKIGQNRLPCLIGARMTTTAILEIMRHYETIGIETFCAGFFTQDCLENIFSVVRSSRPMPSARDFTFQLRAQIVSRFINFNVKGASYECDNSIRQAKISFLNVIRNEFMSSATIEEAKDIDACDVHEKLDDLDNENDFDEEIDISDLTPFSTKLEQNTFYYVCGFILKRTFARSTCDECKSNLIEKDPFPTGYNRLLRSREKEYNTDLIHASIESFTFLIKLEKVFRKMKELEIDFSDTELAYEFTNFVMNNITFNVHCYEIYEKLIDNFVHLRIYICREKRNKHNRNKFSSKSMK